MQETLSIKNMRLAIVAVAMAVMLAFTMGIGAQVAQAEDAVTYGDSVKVTKSGWEYTLTNKSNAKGMSLTGVKKVSKNAATNLKVPSTYTVKKNGKSYTYQVKIVDTGAFKKATKGAKTITLPSTITKIKKGAFTKCSAKKLVVKKKLTKSIAKKGWLKSSKITKVYAKNKATKLVKKSYSGKAKVKAYKK